MVRERLETWKKGHKEELPTNMLFYRDGISESQFPQCDDYEIGEIRKAYEHTGGDEEDLELTFLVVGKRHHTRFYATDEKSPTPATRKANNLSTATYAPASLSIA